MKSTVAFVIAALAALALIVASAAGLSRVCSSQGALAMPVDYREQAADASLRPAVLRADAAFQPAQFGSPWQQRFLCDVKATDVALAGFALFLVLAAFFQGLWMSRALRAMEKSARTMDKAMVATQRAYVVFKEFRVNVTRLSAIEDVQSCAVQPVWENAGTTPTRNGRTHVNWRYFERAIPADFELADFDDMGNRIASYDGYAPLVIGPKGTSFSPVIMLDASTLRMVREGQGRVLIWGWAEYDDVFQDTGRHRTEFCYQLVVAGSPTNYVGFSQYRRFNGVDEDCERKPTLVSRNARSALPAVAPAATPAAPPPPPAAPATPANPAA